MIRYILDFLGVQYAAGSIEYYLVLSVALQIFLACAISLIRWLTAPVDLLIKNRYKN